jgi:hypothetical protein
MASTRNKNTPGNYKAEQWSLEQNRIHQSYIHAARGQAITNHFAGDGLLMGWMPRTELAHNPVEIESFLYGIGSTNLVTPQTAPVPQIKRLDSLSIINKTPVIIPQPLFIEPNQRPLWS